MDHGGASEFCERLVKRLTFHFRRKTKSMSSQKVTHIVRVIGKNPPSYSKIKSVKFENNSVKFENNSEIYTIFIFIRDYGSWWR